MGALALLSVVEYYSLCSHMDYVIMMQRRYKSYCPQENCTSDDSDDDVCGSDEDVLPDDESESDCFALLLVNRSSDYLKQSTLSHLKDEKLDRLVARIDHTEWQDYSDFVLSNAQPKKVVIKKAPRKKTVAKPVRRKTSGIFDWPIAKSGFWLSSFFGPRKQRNGSWKFHYGIDMAALRGTPVKAAGAGVVVEARFVRGYGNTVVISHDEIYKTRYAHLDTIRVKNGARVKKGAKIGTVGDTGFTIKVGKDASHLHFEVCQRGKKVNPLNFLS